MKQINNRAYNIMKPHKNVKDNNQIKKNLHLSKKYDTINIVLAKKI